MLHPNANVTFFNSSFVPRQTQPPWIITMPESQIISFLVCYALILILSLLGNTSIIAIVAKNPSMQSTINYLIINMAATDLASSVAMAGRFFSKMHNLSKEWEVPGVFGEILCKAHSYIRDISISVSIQSMVAIAFDRFFAVVFPTRPTPRILSRLRIVLPIIWCLSLGAFAVRVINQRLISPIQGVHICISKWPTGVDLVQAKTIFFLSIITVIWLVPLTTVAILYTIIALKLRRQAIPGRQSSQTEEARRKRNKRVLKMAFAIVFFFFMCWFPYNIYTIMDLFVWKGSIPNNVDPYLFLVIYDTIIMLTRVSFVINPYICLTFSSKFRKCFRNLFPFSLCFTTRVGPTDVSFQGTLATEHRAMVSSV